MSADRAHLFSTNTTGSRTPSDKSVFATALAIGVFICLVSAVANAFLLSTGLPFSGALIKCDAAGGIAAILLVRQLLRWSRERNQLMRERVRISAELNHDIRNAIQGISLANYQGNSLDSAAIELSVNRIERALHLYAPRLPADQLTCSRYNKSA